MASLAVGGCSFIDDFGRFTFSDDARNELDGDVDVDGSIPVAWDADAHGAIDAGATDADSPVDASSRIDMGTVPDGSVVLDGASSCEDLCAEGRTECRGAFIVTCGVSSTGCLDWGPERLCRTPPPAECVDGVLRSYPVAGTCASGACTYAPPTDISCGLGCAGQSCTLALDLYAKASNADPEDLFGVSVALSADGTTMAVGASEETSTARGIGADQNSNTGDRNGAVYVFRRSAGGSWSQEAYIKASNTGNADYFGEALALSANGATLVVGAWGESSSARGINGDQNNDDAMWSGAVYVFQRSTGATWTQEAFIKASNADERDRFGHAITLSADGAMLAVGAFGEASAAGGVGGNQDSNAARDSGAVYVFRRSAGGSWMQEAYIKASNPDGGDYFGYSVALSSDGATLAVGAWSESSAARGINGDGSNDSSLSSGAAYVFRRNAGSWTQEAYVKASNSDSGDNFGYSVALSADGAMLAVGARGEDSTARGIGGDESANSAVGSSTGAVYVFRRVAGSWAKEAYVKSSNSQEGDRFGWSVALSADGARLAVGAPLEDSDARGTGGAQESNAAIDSGAVYVFRRSTSAIWAQEAYLKASNTGSGDEFGRQIALSGDGTTLAVGAIHEDSAARGIDGDQAGNSHPDSGAAYVYTRSL